MLARSEEVPGPELAGCVAALAALRYAPPQAVPGLCGQLLAGQGRRLRQCGGGELADLGWGLALLQLLYGDVHQVGEFVGGS